MKNLKDAALYLGFGTLLSVMLVIFTLQQQQRPKEAGKWVHPQLEPNDWMAMQRLYPYDRIKHEAFRSATQQVTRLMKEAPASASPWVFSGPDNIGGRITDIESPEGSPSTLYIGGSTGGVLKTTDMGLTWTNIFRDVPVVTVGDIAIDPTNPQVIYCGTGEANSSSFSFLGNGMYKSTDAGMTWQHIGLEQSAYIARVLVDYSNPQRLFAAACGNLFTATDQRGIYRSTDGGATWQRTLFVNDSTAAIEIVQHPTNPQVLYAAMWERIRGLTYRQSFGDGSGIWKSLDGGATWTEMTNGVPTGSDVGRIGITIAKSNPDVLYAFYDLPNYEVGVFKTVNGGQSWTRTNDGNLAGMSSNFGWYFGQIRVDPSNENRVFVMGVSLFRTQNGGSSWEDISTWDLHVDHHAMLFDQTNNRIIEGNDGGLYTSDDQGNSWNKINNLPLTQFYAIDIDQQNPQRIYGGTQDNNTIRTNNGGTSDWDAILGGDGMFTLVDYNDPNTIYAEYQWGNLHRSDDGGWSMNSISGDMLNDRVNWSAPLAMHPDNSETLYFGTYRVWKSTNKGDSWQAVSPDLTAGINQYFYTLTTIAVSKVDPSVIVAGSGDGKLHVSTNNGQTWQDRSAGLPQRWITRVATDPFNSQIIYATLSGFRWDEPIPHVFRSWDLGITWNDITANLPEFPVNDIVIDPDYTDHYLVGTDAGVYATTNGGQYWYWAWDELPAVPIYMMKIHEATRTIVAGTYGLSTYKANLNNLYTGVEKKTGAVTGRISCSPNPVSNSTMLRFYLPSGGVYEIGVYDIEGKFIGKILSDRFPRGEQSVLWTSGKPFPVTPGVLATGTYIIRISGDNFSATTKLIRL